jgi:hypothetical protein
VLGRAAITFGNASDEFLTREAQDSRHQDLMGYEIANGQRRLTELDATIAHFEFLRSASSLGFRTLALRTLCWSKTPPNRIAAVALGARHDVGIDDRQGRRVFRKVTYEHE